MEVFHISSPGRSHLPYSRASMSNMRPPEFDMLVLEEGILGSVTVQILQGEGSCKPPSVLHIVTLNLFHPNKHKL